MNFFRLHGKPISLLWMTLLSITLLFSGDVQVHVHDLDIGSDRHHQHVSGITFSDPDAQASKHLSLYPSHADHHDAVMFEMDISPDSIVQQSLSPATTVDLLVLLFVIFSLRFHVASGRGFCRGVDTVTQRRFHLIPRLRAPPC